MHLYMLYSSWEKTWFIPFSPGAAGGKGAELRSPADPVLPFAVGGPKRWCPGHSDQLSQGTGALCDLLATRCKLDDLLAIHEELGFHCCIRLLPSTGIVNHKHNYPKKWTSFEQKCRLNQKTTPGKLSQNMHLSVSLQKHEKMSFSLDMPDHIFFKSINHRDHLNGTATVVGF